MQNKPNYYAIIPANVRYDSSLSSNAKLLYGEITALCNEKGYCWALNAYFMDLYDLSERQIQRILKNLVEKNYIKVEIIDNFKRKIFIIPPDKNVGGGMTFLSGGYDKNVTHNNIINNKKNINKKSDFFDYDWLREEN